jgi:hypothetical protein
MVRENREGLQGCVQVNETYVGGKNGVVTLSEISQI